MSHTTMCVILIDVFVFLPLSLSRTLLGTPDHSALMQSVVLVATTDIEGQEELLLNYRLNPKAGTLPDWYKPVDVDEDKRRWAQ